MNAPLKKEEDHAYQNAQAWAESISQMVCALECDYDRLGTLTDERDSAAAESDGGVSLAAFDASDEGEEWRELGAAATIDGDFPANLNNACEEAAERIQESPLSLEVRSGWTSLGDTMEAEDFCILLSTGGPALRIRGELGQFNEPRRAWLEYQDWGTPWTEYCGEGCSNDDLLTFCRQFYFGE